MSCVNLEQERRQKKKKKRKKRYCNQEKQKTKTKRKRNEKKNLICVSPQVCGRCCLEDGKALRLRLRQETMIEVKREREPMQGKFFFSFYLMLDCSGDVYVIKRSNKESCTSICAFMLPGKKKSSFLLCCCRRRCNVSVQTTIRGQPSFFFFFFGFGRFIDCTCEFYLSTLP